MPISFVMSAFKCRNCGLTNWDYLNEVGAGYKAMKCHQCGEVIHFKPQGGLRFCNRAPFTECEECRECEPSRFKQTTLF